MKHVEGSEGSLQGLLSAGLEELADPATPEMVARLAALAELVATWTRRVDLTAHETPEAVTRHLVLDALALVRALPPFESLADVGSGAGFPGLPIAIRYPDRQVVLVEARERRHHFQRAALRALGLRNAEALRGRAEALTPRECDLAIAQAIAEPDAALPILVRWARLGGWLVIPGGEEAPRPGRLPGLGATTVVSYQVPLGGPRRMVWLGRRAS